MNRFLSKSFSENPKPVLSFAEGSETQNNFQTTKMGKVSNRLPSNSVLFEFRILFRWHALVSEGLTRIWKLGKIRPLYEL